MTRRVAGMDSFLLTALIAGLGVAAFMAPLGAFVVWRRMAYFGDALAHSALLGVALGFLLGINASLAVFAVCVVLALALVGLRQGRLLADDTLLGILSHGALSLGLVAIAFMETLRIDLMAYLFGDILAVSWTDIAWIYGGGALALAGLARIWRPLVAITVHEELARVEGVRAFRVQLGFMLLIAVVIALAMKIVGILLVTSLLIIPAATARRFAASPEQMAGLAAVIGCLAVTGGLGGALLWDLPSGPAIVVAAAALFLAGLAVPIRRRAGA
jgi:zinc transport system permease protein